MKKHLLWGVCLLLPVLIVLLVYARWAALILSIAVLGFTGLYFIGKFVDDYINNKRKLEKMERDAEAEMDAEVERLRTEREGLDVWGK